MFRTAIGALLVFLICIACGSSSDASTNDTRVEQPAPAKYKSDYERQIQEYDAQTRKIQAQLAETERQIKRQSALIEMGEAIYRRQGALLDKQEQQIKRYDKILDRWEAQAQR